MTVNKERVELFVQALESDGYIQCRQSLRRGRLTNLPNMDVQWTHCALGVAVDVALKHGLQRPERVLRANWETWLWNHGTLPAPVMEWYGFEDPDPEITIDEGVGPIVTSVAGANDDVSDFWTIAQAVRAQYLKDES